MLLHEQITQSLAGLKGLADPRTVGWSADGGTTIEADFTAVDSLSCAVRELRISADVLRTASMDELKAWADALCRRVTYLLEQIGPLEQDAEAQTVLVRSTPPTKEPDRISYYEMLVHAPGQVNLRRYTRAADGTDRQATDMLVTHEVLQRLVRDIVDAIPAVATA